MTDKVWLTDPEVRRRVGSTHQWVWTQTKTKPRFPQPVKLTLRELGWCLQEIEAFEQEVLLDRGTFLVLF